VTSLADILADGVAAQTTPGAAAAVITPTRTWLSCAGACTIGGAAVDEHTIYDLASLTKLLATTVLVADGIHRNLFSLDDTICHQWRGVTVRHALQHTTGLPAHVPLWEGRTGPPDAAAVVAAAQDFKPVTPPGQVTLYSDIGMIVLGDWLEQRLGVTLDDAFAAWQSEHLRSSLRYVRLSRTGFHPQLAHTAPTEVCPWRRRTMHGQVHDENAYALDGVAGHAGLFGSLVDVVTISSWLLSAIRCEPSTRTIAGVLSAFAAAPGERGIGFDRATADGSTGGALSPSTVGHLGFTGTSVWLDPQANRAYVLLTNRVHFGRLQPQAIKGLRIAFHQFASGL
jgi:serine-type D-Ala-D-Ala carboxypeptidase